jgi:hypothetical protein
LIIYQVQNGQISVNQASEKYWSPDHQLTIYWLNKYSSLEQKKLGMSKKDEIEKKNMVDPMF